MIGSQATLPRAVKTKLFRLGIGLLALVFVGAVTAILLAPSWRHHRLIRESQPVQVALENFRQQHGIYPETLSAGKISEPDEIYYRRKSDGSYILWFGLELGESMTFRSTDRKWE